MGDGPVRVAEKFWGALEDGDLEKARYYATEETANSLTMNEEGEDEEADVEFGVATVEGEYTVVPTTIISKGDPPEPTIELETLLVREDGKWKVDVARTMLSMFDDEMGELMEGMTDAMGDAMQNLGKAMTEEMEKLGKKMEEELKNTNSNSSNP